MVAVQYCNAGIRALRSELWSLVVLDIMLPMISGLDVLRQMRRISQVPVLILSARGDDDDRVTGLELGADDYLAKPFYPRELLARVRAILRRTHSGTPDNEPPMVLGDLTLDPAKREVIVKGVPLRLTSAEIRLLSVLMRNSGSAVSRETLCEEVLGRKLVPADRCIDTHVSHIRSKLVSAGGATMIASVRGTGYQLVAG